MKKISVIVLALALVFSLTACGDGGSGNGGGGDNGNNNDGGNGSKTVTGITANYEQGFTVVNTTTPLNNLKTDLTVTAHYSDSTSADLAANDYTLSGTLTAGTSTVTVNYSGKSDTFSVAVLADGQALMYWGYLTWPTDYDYLEEWWDDWYKSEFTWNPVVITKDDVLLSLNGSGYRTILIPDSLGPLAEINNVINQNTISLYKTKLMTLSGVSYYVYSSNSEGIETNLGLTLKF